MTFSFLCIQLHKIHFSARDFTFTVGIINAKGVVVWINDNVERNFKEIDLNKLELGLNTWTIEVSNAGKSTQALDQFQALSYKFWYVRSRCDKSYHAPNTTADLTSEFRVPNKFREGAGGEVDCIMQHESE